MLGKEKDVLIGVPELGRKKEQPTNIHRDLLDKYKFPYYSSRAVYSLNILDCIARNANLEFFGCGPLKNFGHCLLPPCTLKINRATMQGGFIGYDVHGLPCKKLAKFEGKVKVATFNLNGDKKGALRFLEMENIRERRFVSKNVCHTVTYDKRVHEIVKSVPPKDRASELLREGMDLRFKSNPEGKVFHDPTAAVCHIHPEIATWVRAKLYCEKGEWGANLDDNGDYIIVDVDQEKIWNHIANGT
jgi:pyrimidine-specific ribonucleoside hydrolase